MARMSIISALLAIASFTSAQQVSHEPCNKIRQYITTGNELPASVAYSCLTSVPFNKATGKAVVENYKKWTAFHSTVGDLKNPGSGYANEPVDLMALLDEMITKIDADTYTNQYQFEEDMAYLSFKSYDGHYTFRGPTFSMFQWIRGEMPSWYDRTNTVYEGALISVSASKKGDVLPEVYFHSDLNNGEDASPITKINNMDVKEYLEKEMTHQTFQDPDARWNTLFAREQADSPGAWIVPFTYPGSNFTATFKNGTSKTVQTFAQVYTQGDIAKWYSVVDGKTFYDVFVKPSKTTSGAGAAGTAKPIIGERSVGSLDEEAPVVKARALPKSNSICSTKRNTSPNQLKKRAMPPNYPTPVVTHDTQQIGAFFLDAPGLEDVAVLSFNSFASEDPHEVQQFQWLVEKFLKYAKEQKKTKMIIDVSSNGGGTLFLAYDVFKQFFPTIEPDIGVRHPATDAVNIIGSQFGTINQQSPNTEYALGLTAQGIYMSPLHWASNVNATLSPFTSWSQMAGPVMLNDYPFTNTLRYNLSYENLGTGGLQAISGYGSRANLAPQPFGAEDIVLVHDGYCASTCSIFTDLMRRQGGVRSIALGGRPGLGPMQSVGGTKGAILLSWQSVYPWIASVTQFFGTEAQRKAWKQVLPSTWPINMDANPPNVNGRNAYHPGSATPLQFLNETAECRLFYTPAMLTNITEVWDAVARVAWGRKGGVGQTCVPGSVTDGMPIGNVNLTSTDSDSGSALPKSGTGKVGAKGNIDDEAPNPNPKADDSGADSGAASGMVVDYFSIALGLVVAGVFSQL